MASRSSRGIRRRWTWGYGPAPVIVLALVLASCGGSSNTARAQGDDPGLQDIVDEISDDGTGERPAPGYWTPDIGATTDRFVVVEGIPDDRIRLFDFQGEELVSLDLPFSHPTFRPQIATNAQDRLVVAGVPCETTGGDDFVECGPGGVAAAVLDLHTLEWVSVFDRLPATEGTPWADPAGFLGDEALISVDDRSIALPVGDGEPRDLGRMPIDARQVCASDDGAIAVTSGGGYGSTEGHGTTWQPPFAAAHLDPGSTQWPDQALDPPFASGPDVPQPGYSVVGCSPLFAIAVPVVPPTGSEPSPVYRFSSEAQGWDPVDDPPIALGEPGPADLPIAYEAAASPDGSVDVFAVVEPGTVLTLDGDGHWTRRTRTDDLDEIQGFARVGDQYIAVDNDGGLAFATLAD